MTRPTPSAIKRLAGNPGHRPIRDDEPTPARGRPSVPPHLAGEALAEWRRIVDELDQMGLLTTTDRTGLALYTRAWQRWVHAEQQIDATGGEVVDAPKTGVPMQNPWLSIANAAHAQVLRLLAEFGLTPSARTRIRLPSAMPTDPFADLDADAEA